MIAWVRRRRVLVGAVGAVVVLLVATVAVVAGGGRSPATPHERAAAPSTTTTTAAPIPTAPLTGLPDPDGVARGRPALSVKIGNTPDARPQSGLDLADVVYEEVVEGGITRLWAVFNSAAPESVGSIRSVRAIDPLIVTPLGGVVVFSGGTDGNVAAMRATPVTAIDENNAGDAFFRDSRRASPHNLYGRTASLWARGGQPVPPRPLFTYLDAKLGESFVGEAVDGVHVLFQMGYDVRYQWDATTRGWQRTQGGQPFVSDGGTQLAPTNVVIQFIVGGESEGELLGQGDAWILSAGQLIRGRWTRTAADQPTVFTDAVGSPIELTPGRTWVELYPNHLPVPVVAASTRG